jgi:hypothetical protein
MKRFTLFAVLALPFALVGCGNDDVMSPTSDPGLGGTGSGISAADRAAIEADIATQVEIFDDLAFEEAGEEVLPFDTASAELSPYSEGPEAEDLCRRFHWFRHIRERSRVVVIRLEESDSVQKAHVNVTTKLAGSFNILVRSNDDPSLGSMDGEWIRKPLRDIGRRHAIYLRRIDGGGGEDGKDEGLTADRRGWHLAAISNHEVASPEHTANIRKLRIETRSGLAVEIDDPLELMRFPQNIPHVLTGEPIRVTAWTRDPTNAVFLYARWGRQMMRPVDGEEGAFVGMLMAPETRRFFHFGVNALTRGTLFDPRAPYDSDFWGVLAAAAPAPEPVDGTAAE